MPNCDSEWEKVLRILKETQMVLSPKMNTSSLNMKYWRPDIFAIIGNTALRLAEDSTGSSLNSPVIIYIKEKYLNKKKSSKVVPFLDKFKCLIEKEHGLKYQQFEGTSAGEYILKQINKFQKEDAGERNITFDTAETENLELIFKSWDNRNIHHLLNNQPKEEQVLLNTDKFFLLKRKGNDLVVHNPQVQVTINQESKTSSPLLNFDIWYQKFQKLIDDKKVPPHTKKPIYIPFKPKSAKSLLDKFKDSIEVFEQIFEYRDSNLFKDTNSIMHLAFIICINGDLLKYQPSSSYVEQLLKHFLGEKFLPVDYQVSSLIDDPIFQQLIKLFLDISLDEIFCYSSTKKFLEEESSDSFMELNFKTESLLSEGQIPSLDTSSIQDIEDVISNMGNKSSQQFAFLDGTFSDIRSGWGFSHH